MATTKWVLDPTHSELQFRVKHLAISTVTGQFNRFSATVETEGEDISTAKVHLTADIDSISTNNEQRDAHLKNNDFFDAANHPKLVFEGDRLEKISDEEYRLHGALTIRGVTKNITLLAEFGGKAADPWGNTRVGFSVSGKISRKDFGISFGLVSDTGSIVVGDEVKIFASAQFVLQKALEPVA